MDALSYLGSLGDAVVAGWGLEAVTTTEWNITLASDDENWSLQGVRGSSSTANGEELSDGDWLRTRKAEWKDGWVKLSWSKEIGLDGAWGGSTEVAVWVRGESLVLVCLDEITAKLEEWQESTVLAESGETDSVRNVWVLSSEGVSLNGAERVTDVDDLLELGDGLDLATTDHVGELAEGLNLNLGLDLVDRLAVLRHADTQTVVRESRVAVVVNCLVDVRVVEVVEWNVPVAAVEANTVGEHLDGVGVTPVRSTESGRQVVGALDVLVLHMASLIPYLIRPDIHTYALKLVHGVVVTLLRQVKDEVRHVNVRVRSQCILVEERVPGIDSDRNRHVRAFLRGGSRNERSSNCCGGEGLHLDRVVIGGIKD